MVVGLHDRDGRAAALPELPQPGDRRLRRARHRRQDAPALLEEIAEARFRAGMLGARRSEEHTSELQSLMRISYAVFCLKKKTEHTAKDHLHLLHISVLSGTEVDI